MENWSLWGREQFSDIAETDPSGLQYLRVRYYSPEQGRFISRDQDSICQPDFVMYKPSP